MHFESKVLDVVKSTNPYAKANFFNGTLFIETNSEVGVSDAYQIVGALTLSFPDTKVMSSRVGIDIAVDFG